ncbi:hypothetical protein [Zobellia uliginosa]|uniref:hypothetical protein n=1 Tax=Zobellia uliginosa TaxID=143224 RepID=UPI001C071031|nr:hypothetical protein [Zobellia uliginosa]MBU2945284.1 hypothetical protein [Zobellia uliginosa]
MNKTESSKLPFILMLVILLVGIHSCNTDYSGDFEDYDIDTDGDGIFDSEEVINGTDKNNPCDPPHTSEYSSFNSSNFIWLAGDCDNDGLNNEDELSAGNNPYGNPTVKVYAVPEFLPRLSELKLFKDNMSDLQLNDNVFEYGMSTPLFTDYSYKLRVVALPEDKQITYKGGNLLDFPDNTILAKTFYYLKDERDPSLGKKCIETRVLIKKKGQWLVRNYFWNEDQTDAVLDDDAHNLQVDWVDSLGISKTIDYVVPSNTMCIQCHELNGKIIPIGPKARAMNFEHRGQNILQFFKDNNMLVGAPDVSEIPVLPDWSDTNLPLEERARAYLDVNCAHCHQKGGSYNRDFGDKFTFTFESSLEESNIYLERTQITDRMGTQIPGYFMPLVGTSIKHTEGIDLINEYLNSLEH